MQIITIKEGLAVKLQVNISSEAIVGSYIGVNDIVKRRSELYKFSTDLGKIDELDQNIISIVSNFFVAIGDFNPIFNNTIVSYSLKFGQEEKKLDIEKLKVSSDLFMSYTIVKLAKI